MINLQPCMRATHPKGKKKQTDIKSVQVIEIHAFQITLIRNDKSY